MSPHDYLLQIPSVSWKLEFWEDQRDAGDPLCTRGRIPSLLHGSVKVSFFWAPLVHFDIETLWPAVEDLISEFIISWHQSWWPMYLLFEIKTTTFVQLPLRSVKCPFRFCILSGFQCKTANISQPILSAHWRKPYWQSSPQDTMSTPAQKCVTKLPIVRHMSLVV